MTKYIKKSALVTEIKTRIETYNKGYANGDDCRADALETFLHDIDFLEVKEVEVPVSNDLEEACDEYYDETWDKHGGKAMVVDGCHDIWFPSQATDDFFKAGARWQAFNSLETIKGMEEQAFLAGVEAEQINQNYGKDPICLQPNF